MIIKIYTETPFGLKRIGKMFGMAHISVRDILIKNGVKTGKKRPTKVEIESALDKVSMGMYNGSVNS